MDQIRSVRIGKIAVADVAATAAGAYWLSKDKRDFARNFLLLLAAGEVLHYLLGVKTPVTEKFFPLS